MPGNAKVEKARERSVNNLQRLYTVVISLAITVTLKNLFEDVLGYGTTSGNGVLDFPKYYGHLLRFISFIVTVVPFFHGANRYLDETYVTGESGARRYALLIDFIAFFLEGLGIFVLAMYARIDNNFYVVLGVVLLFDILWVLSTYITATGNKPKIKWWAVVNIGTVSAVFIVLWSSLCPGDVVKSWILVLICTLRTALDYILVWPLYYPEMPVPFPASAREKGNSRTIKLNGRRNTGAKLVRINDDKIDAILSALSTIALPSPSENTPEQFPLCCDKSKLANAYLGIVAICHQTSPIGERPFEGSVNGTHARGWDYLRAKFLLKASEAEEWTSFRFWQTLTPGILGDLFEDKTYGRTLNRISERTYLLNDLGNGLSGAGYDTIQAVFAAEGNRIGGETGFITYLSAFAAYSDPVGKKSHFFLSLAQSECGWALSDKDNLLSPVDYHELRGHLRIGTVRFDDEGLARRVRDGIPLAGDEDAQLRERVQVANERLAKGMGISGSALHYFLWNFFRACCKRRNARCEDCGLADMAGPYADLFAGRKACPFRGLCDSADKPIKPDEPPYIGHFY